MSREKYGKRNFKPEIHPVMEAELNELENARQGTKGNGRKYIDGFLVFYNYETGDVS